MQYFRTDPTPQGVGYPIIGANSDIFNPADAVYIDSNGFLANASTSSKILGFALDTITMASDNQTVGFVKPKYAYAGDLEVVYGSDQDCTQTDIGAYADLGTVTSNAHELNLAAGATGQFLVLGFDPRGEDDDDAVVVCVAEPQKLAFAQA